MHYLNLLQMCKRTYSVCDNIAGQDKLLVATSPNYSFARPWCGGILVTHVRNKPFRDRRLVHHRL